MDITAEMNKMASELEKSVNSTPFSMDLLKGTILSLGPDGLRKALPNLSEEQRSLLSNLLEDMAKSHDQVIANDRKVSLEPVTNSTPDGDYLFNEDDKPAQTEHDEKVAKEAEKKDQADVKHQGGGAPVEGWDGQVIKSEGANNEEAQVMAPSFDERKKVAKANVKAMMKRAQERGLEKGEFTILLGKSLNIDAEVLGQVWDLVKALPEVGPAESTAQSAVPTQMKKEENAGVHDPEDPSVPKPKEAKKTEIEIPEGETQAPKIAKSDSYWYKEDETGYFAKSEANPFFSRTTGQNVSYSVDALIDLQAASQNQRLAKSTFDYQHGDNEDLNKAKKTGEGSRGGKVIGHTKSGKPIYDHANHPEHANFTAEDHDDATDHHVAAQGPLEGKIQSIERDKQTGAARGTRGYDHSGQVSAIDKRNHHKKMAQLHDDASYDLKNAVKKSDMDPAQQVVDANAKKQAQAKKNDAEEIRQIKTDEKLSHIEANAGPKMGFVKGKMKKCDAEEMIAKSLDMDQETFNLAVSNLRSPALGAFLVKSFADDEMDALFASQDMWDLEKGIGEGSRGGKVIGHTKSGKPIYDHAEHKSHKDFSSKDHGDAAAVHDKMSSSSRPDSFGGSDHHDANKGKHERAAEHHRRELRAKTPKDTPNDPKHDDLSLDSLFAGDSKGKK